MNPFTSEESITIDGVSVNIPTLSNKGDSVVTFKKPM